MTAVLHHLPVDAFAAARAVLRAPPETTSRDQIAAACNRLAASHHWQDIELVRQMRNALWTAPRPTPRFGPPAPLAVPTIPVFDAAPRRAPIARPVRARPAPLGSAFTAYAIVMILMIASLLGWALITNTQTRTAATLAQAEQWLAMYARDPSPKGTR